MSVIRFLFLDGKTSKEIKVKLHAVYMDHAPSTTTIRYWFNEFKRGRTSVFDEERAAHPIEATTGDMVKKIHDIVLAERRLKIRQIADIVDISTECMRKLSAKWMPRLLTVEHDNFA